MNSLLPHVLLNTERSGRISSRRDRKGASVNENLERALTAARFHTLVRAVGTVFVSVTLPTLRDAHVGSGTLERLRAAGFGLCNRNSSWIFATSQGIPGSTTGVCARAPSVAFRLPHSLHLLSSSLLSPQSSAPSHTQRWGMQRWLVHSNWLLEQNLSASARKGATEHRTFGNK